jgi:hypothetical protein
MSEDRIALRLKTLEMAAGLNAPNYDLNRLFETAGRLWAWCADETSAPAKSKTTRAVEASVARLSASQKPIICKTE